MLIIMRTIENYLRKISCIVVDNQIKQIRVKL